MRFTLRLFETDDEKKAREAKEAADREDRERNSRRRGEDGRYLPYDDIEKANARIHELNNENAARRTENKELKDAMKTLNDSVAATKAEIDRNRERARRAEARAALVDAKISDPDLTDMFLKHAGDKVKFDESGEVVGLKETLAEFKKVKPHFFPAEPVLDKDGKPVLENGKPKMTPGYALPPDKGTQDATTINGKPNSTARSTSSPATTGGEGDKKIDLMERDEKGNFKVTDLKAVEESITASLRTT